MIEFEQKGLNETVEMLKDLSIKDVVKDTMETARIRAESLAEHYCPVDTGELLDSIYSRTIENGFELGADAAYAVFNEYGSIRTPIGTVEVPIPAKYVGFRPFLRPALYQVRNEMPEIFGKKLQEVMAIRVASR